MTPADKDNAIVGTISALDHIEKDMIELHQIERKCRIWLRYSIAMSTVSCLCWLVQWLGKLPIIQGILVETSAKG